MSRATWDTAGPPSLSPTGLSPAMADLSRSFGWIGRSLVAVPQPHETGASWFGLFPVRSPLLGESRLISFPPGTEMFHFPGLSRPRLCIQRGVAGRMPAGLPHSEIPGSTRVCRSPGLIAAYHVLLRLRMPRHPPCALSNLTGYDSSYPFVHLSSILGYVADAGHGSFTNHEYNSR